MEGSNGQYYQESPLSLQEDAASHKIMAAFGENDLTLNKIKQPSLSTNVFRVLSDPSALTISKDPCSSKSEPMNQITKNIIESTSVTITKVVNNSKTDSTEQLLSRSGKDLSVGSMSDLSSDTSKMDEDSYDSASFYSTNEDNNMNLDNSNPDEVRAFECDECGKTFKRSDHLKKHKTTHSGLKPYECDLCGKKYTQSGSLKIHKMTHSNAKFQCDSCPRLFTQTSSLNLHKKIHLVDRTYECRICNKVYNNSANLAVHQRIHNDSFKFFTCDICGRKFTQKGNLNTHKMIHDNIRPYKCDICGKEFVQKNNYFLHLKTHEKNSTSGHVAAAKKPPTKISNHMEGVTQSCIESDELDDSYLDDYIVGNVTASESSSPKVITSTPEKKNSVKEEISKSVKEIIIDKDIQTLPTAKNASNSVPFVCMDCNNKPFSEKCRLSNHKMYVLF